MKISGGASSKLDSSKAAHTIDISRPFCVLLLENLSFTCFRTFFAEPSLDIPVFLPWMLAPMVPATVALLHMAELKFLYQREDVSPVSPFGVLEVAILRVLGT